MEGHVEAGNHRKEDGGLACHSGFSGNLGFTSLPRRSLKRLTCSPETPPI